MTAVVSNVSLHFWDSIDFSQVSETEATVFLLEIERGWYLSLRW